MSETETAAADREEDEVDRLIKWLRSEPSKDRVSESRATRTMKAKVRPYDRSVKRFTAVTVILLLLLGYRALAWTYFTIQWTQNTQIGAFAWIPGAHMLAYMLASLLVLLKRKLGSIIAAVIAVYFILGTVTSGASGVAGDQPIGVAYLLVDLLVDGVILFAAYKEYRQVSQVAKATEEPPSPPI